MPLYPFREGILRYLDGTQTGFGIICEYTKNNLKLQITIEKDEWTVYKDIEKFDEKQGDIEEDDIFVFLLNEERFQRVIVESGTCDPFVKMEELLQTRKCIAYGFSAYTEPEDRDDLVYTFDYYDACKLFDANLRSLIKKIY